jgi:hypothetical protein
MAGYPYYISRISRADARDFGNAIKRLLATDTRTDKEISSDSLYSFEYSVGIGEDFDYCLGFYTALAYVVELKKEIEKIKEEAEQRLRQQEISMRQQQFQQMLRQQPPQPVSKIEKRYQQMRQGTVKPRFRSDVPTELLRKMRERGYSYERISRETGLSKSAVIYRLK